MYHSFFSTSALSHVYRLHHAPIVPITLNSLISRAIEPFPKGGDTTQWKKKNEAAIVSSAQYLHHEIPIRLAGRIVDLENLPGQLSQAESVLKLRKMLINSFEEMIESPVPIDLTTEQNFMKMQMAIRSRHAKMHDGLYEALQQFGNVHTNDSKLVRILDKFYHSRIGIRLLVDQHMALQQPKQDFVGLINNHCCPMDVVQDVVRDTVAKCKTVFGERTPLFEIEGTQDAKFCYIPQHLAIILTEVFANAIQNVIALGTENNKIQVFIAGGERGVCIKTTDFGKSMHWEDVPKLWSYCALKETSGYDPVATSNVQDRVTESTFGMPIARLYARYFGGELALMPMEGWGTDTYVHLKRLNSST